MRKHTTTPKKSKSVACALWYYRKSLSAHCRNIEINITKNRDFTLAHWRKLGYHLYGQTGQELSMYANPVILGGFVC